MRLKNRYKKIKTKPVSNRKLLMNKRKVNKSKEIESSFIMTKSIKKPTKVKNKKLLGKDKKTWSPGLDFVTASRKSRKKARNP